MSKRFWRIRGYDSMKLIFDITVSTGTFTSAQLEHLLQALTAKAGLNFREIVGAYAKNRTKMANHLLDIHVDVKHSTYMCGSNPHFTASLVDETGKILINPHI